MLAREAVAVTTQALLILLHDLGRVRRVCKVTDGWGRWCFRSGHAPM